MKKTSSLPLWGIGLITTGIISAGLLIALVQISQLSKNYTWLSDEYIRLADEYRRLGATDLGATEVPSAAGFGFVQGLLVFVGLILLISEATILVTVTIKQRRQALEHQRQLTKIRGEHERQLTEARRLGREEGLRTIAQELVADEDVLAELISWLQKYQKGQANLTDSARIHSRVLELLVKEARLIPVSRVDDVVVFDPRMHTTYDNLRPGDKAVVAEPGWRFAQDILKLPVVRRRS